MLVVFFPPVNTLFDRCHTMSFTSHKHFKQVNYFLCLGLFHLDLVFTWILTFLDFLLTVPELVLVLDLDSINMVLTTALEYSMTWEYKY